MTRLFLAALSTIALSTAFSLPASALSERFDDARDATINKLTDRFEEERQDTLNQLIPTLPKTLSPVRMRSTSNLYSLPLIKI